MRTWLMMPAPLSARFIRNTSSSLSSTSKMERSVAIRMGKGEPKIAAASEFRFEPDFTAHPGNRPFNNGQSDAGAFVLFFRIDAAEHLEYPVVMLRVDADSIVADPD